MWIQTGVLEIERIRVFEAFAGIGSQRMALHNLGIPHEVVGIAEIDKYAIQSYNAIWLDKTLNLGDISKIKLEDVPDMDLFTYSFPCTDISQAGKMIGFEEGSGTRSSLLWECKRIIDGKKPKYLLLENVKNLVGKKFKPDFDLWLEWLSEQGYTNYWKVLNAKDYGIPQNRERVFVISILGEHEPYKFPEKLPLTLRMKDLLEDTVDEKFYLSQEQINKIRFSTFNTNTRRIQEKDWCDTLYTRDFKDSKCVKINQIGQYDKPNRKNCSIYRVYNDNGLSPSLSTMQGGHREPHVCEQRSDEGLRFFKNNICGSLRTNNSCYVRKLTPKECWRLMGFPDWAFSKAEQVCSNSQLYKQAGNSIVVNVLEGILKNLFK